MSLPSRTTAATPGRRRETPSPLTATQSRSTLALQSNESRPARGGAAGGRLGRRREQREGCTRAWRCAWC
eukprot:4004812-Prymnesium_polylepis.1